MNRAFEIRLISGMADIPEAAWDACACPEAAEGRALDPFTRWRFLDALERSGSVGEGTGWEPRHATLYSGDDLIAVAPLYLKFHSQGEYVFDHGWADAFERAGGRYYPKLQGSVPFTPVTGCRLLAKPGFEAEARRALLAGMAQIADQSDLSSVHLTFCTETEANHASDAWLHRIGQQYHWLNQGYSSYEEFLASLSSRKRKALRKERARAQSFGGTIRHLTGEQIEPAHWDAMWAFYQDTGGRKWGRPYLTRAFFDDLHAMRDDVLLVFAERDGVPVAGALNLIGREALFGRYWGCIEDHTHLHFELCYHQAIDWAIAQGLKRVEAGAQGDHKLARGYMPVPTHSLHWIGHPGLRAAVADYLAQERAAISEDIAALADYGPFRKAET